MTRQEVYDYIVAQLAVPVTVIEKFLNSFSKVLDFITESTVDQVIPDWTNVLTFNTDGSGDGVFCRHPDINGNKRIFETKTDGNIGNEPPTDPEITENTFWLEISQSAGSSIKEWAAGVFGSGYIIVGLNHSVHGRGLAILLDPVRPFNSSDIEAEITAGKWEFIAINKQYVDDKITAAITGINWKQSVWAATTGNISLSGESNIDGQLSSAGLRILVKNQTAATENGIYISSLDAWPRAEDCDSSNDLQNAVVSVDRGDTNADTSWRQASDAVTIGLTPISWVSFGAAPLNATENEKGIVELATTAEATTGADTQRAVTPAGLKAHVDAMAGINDTDIKYFEQWDWLGSVADGSNNPASGWAALFSSTGGAGWSFTQHGANSTEKAFGAIQVQTGTDSNGYSNLAHGHNLFTVGVGHTLKLRMRSALKILSDGTNRYTVYQGFGDVISAGQHSNGAYFRYNDSVNAGNWQAVTRKDGIETASDTVVAADLLFSIFEIRINADGTSVEFYINGALVATHTTNIPSTADYTGINFKILKALGTTNREFVMDWYDFLITRTTPR